MSHAPCLTNTHTHMQTLWYTQYHHHHQILHPHQTLLPVSGWMGFLHPDVAFSFFRIIFLSINAFFSWFFYLHYIYMSIDYWNVKLWCVSCECWDGKCRDNTRFSTVSLRNTRTVSQNKTFMIYFVQEDWGTTLTRERVEERMGEREQERVWKRQ